MLRYELRGPAAWLTIDRPDKLNAMTRAFFGELQERLDRADADAGARCVMIEGAGRCFSVGGDIEGFGDLTGAADRRAYLREAITGFRAVEEFTKPTIAAVHGHALGGGCELTFVCDIVVADETARFGLPEAAVGLLPGPGVVRGWPREPHPPRLKHMIFTGEVLEAEDAMRVAGIVNRGHPRGRSPRPCGRLGRQDRRPLAARAHDRQGAALGRGLGAASARGRRRRDAPGERGRRRGHRRRSSRGARHDSKDGRAPSRPATTAERVAELERRAGREALAMGGGGAGRAAPRERPAHGAASGSSLLVDEGSFYEVGLLADAQFRRDEPCRGRRRRRRLRADRRAEGLRARGRRDRHGGHDRAR